MGIVLNILLLIVGFTLLAKGADFFVDGASGIATKLKIPQIVIGLTIVAMGTSAPEAAVSISAALKGNAEITIGNIVGSNILNVLIILGLSSVIAPLVVKKSTAYIDMPVVIVSSIVLLLLGLDGSINLIDGIILLVMFISYLTYLFIMTKKENKEKSEEKEEVKVNILKSIIFAIIGLGAIILGSNISVESATAIAKELGVSDRFIGLTIVALGTSLPELFTSVSASLKKNSDIAIGNIVGSNIFNLLFIVGTSSVITPVVFASNFIIDTLIAIASAIVLFLFCLKNKKLGRIGGITLLIGYALYFVYLLV